MARFAFTATIGPNVPGKGIGAQGTGVTVDPGSQPASTFTTLTAALQQVQTDIAAISALGVTAGATGATGSSGAIVAQCAVATADVKTYAQLLMLANGATGASGQVVVNTDIVTTLGTNLAMTAAGASAAYATLVADWTTAKTDVTNLATAAGFVPDTSNVVVVVDSVVVPTVSILGKLLRAIERRALGGYLAQ